jgi:hypothetical protein
MCQGSYCRKQFGQNKHVGRQSNGPSGRFDGRISAKGQPKQLCCQEGIGRHVTQFPSVSPFKAMGKSEYLMVSVLDETDDAPGQQNCFGSCGKMFRRSQRAPLLKFISGPQLTPLR